MFNELALKQELSALKLKNSVLEQQLKTLTIRYNNIEQEIKVIKQYLVQGNRANRQLTKTVKYANRDQ